MRSGLAVLGLAVLVATSAAAEPIAQDPAGDTVAGGGTPTPAGSFPAADLLGLSIDAVPPDLVVSFHVGGTDAEAPMADSAMYTLDFVFDGARYLLMAERNVPVFETISPPTPAGEVYSATLFRFDDGIEYWDPYLELPEPVETAPGVIAVAMPLQKIVDPTGLPVRNGSQLTAVVAESFHNQDRMAGGATSLPFPPPADRSPVPLPFILHDRLPDVDTLTHALQLPTTGGAVLLDSPDPARATNGGPGTFVYPLRATNAADVAVLATFAVDGLPDGWVASIVDEQLELGPQESRMTSVVVRPPLNHVHGVSTNITVRVLVDGQPTEGQVVLQLLYSDPAQPAGHHPVLYLHSASPSDLLMFYTVAEPTLGWSNRFAFMNTLEEDDSASGGPVDGFGSDAGDGWRVPLSPGLGMGLDFDLAGQGMLHATFASTNALPVEDVTFQASLVLSSEAGDLLVAEGPTIGPMTVAEGTAVELPLAILPAGDYVPYAPRTNLELVVSAIFTEPVMRIGLTSLRLLDGGWLDLPLQEYQDQIPLQDLGGLSIRAEPEPARANPGDRVAFSVRLRNEGTQAVSASVEPLDVSTQSIAALSPSRLRIEPGQEATLAVDVLVPDTALDGELFAAFVAVRPDAGGNAALVRLTTQVTTADEVESAAGAAAKDTPGLGGPLLLVTLALAFAATRTRRGS